MECNIDLSYIRELIDDDPGLLKDFVADIIVQLKETDLLIRQHLEEQNFAGLASAAHKLKSSIKIVGGHSLYEKLHTLELLATERKELDEIISLYEAIQTLSASCEERLLAIA